MYENGTGKNSSFTIKGFIISWSPKAGKKSLLWAVAHLYNEDGYEKRTWIKNYIENLIFKNYFMDFGSLLSTHNVNFFSGATLLLQFCLNLTLNWARVL